MEVMTHTRVVVIRNGSSMKGREILSMNSIAKDYSFVAQDDGADLELQMEYINPSEKNAVDTTIRLLEQYVSIAGYTSYTYDRKGEIEIRDEESTDSISQPIGYIEPNTSGV